MRRRRYLRSVSGVLGLAATATVPSRVASGTGASRATDDEFGPLGRIGIERAAEAVPSADGSHAFVANHSGVRVVDVTDPANPELAATLDPVLGEHENGPMRLIMDCKVDGDRLLVVGPGHPTSDGYHGLALFDVSDPADPTLVRSHETGYSIHNCMLDGGLAYLARGTGIEIVDVGPEQPQPVGRWKPTDADDAYADVHPLFRVMHDLYVQDGRAYLANWDLGTFVLDVSDPAEPEHLATVSERPVEELEDPENDDEYLEPPGNDHYVQPSDDGTLLAVGMETWDVDPEGGDDPGGPSGIELWDLSDLDAPEQVGLIDPPDSPEGKRALRDQATGYWTTAHNFDIREGYLYSSWYQGGVRVHDVSDPANPREVAAWEDGEAASFWTAKLAVPGDFFVASDEGAYDSHDGALYTFPDPGGRSSSSLSTPVSTGTPTAGTPGSTVTPNPERTRTPASDPTPTGTPTAGSGSTAPAESPSPTAPSSPVSTDPPESGGSGSGSGPGSADDGTASASGPGLDPLAGLSAVGLGAWFLRRGENGEGGGGGKGGTQ